MERNCNWCGCSTFHVAYRDTCSGCPNHVLDEILGDDRICDDSEYVCDYDSCYHTDGCLIMTCVDCDKLLDMVPIFMD